MTGPMGLVYPVDGGSTNVWDTVLDAMFALIEPHDHSSGKGVQVPSAGLGINADVSWASYAITALKGIAFTEQAASAVASYSDLLFVNSSDHNLYFRNSGGTNVQITEGNGLDVSLVGGIGGDYSSVGALLSYVDAAKNYELFQEGSPAPWAGLSTADISLYQKAASIANAVTLKSPSSLASGYSWTFPTALPGSTGFLTLNSAGQVAIGGLTETLIIPPSMAIGAVANQTTDVNGAMYAWTFADAGAVTYPVALPQGSVITGYSIYTDKISDTGTTLSARLATTSSGSVSQLGSGSSLATNTPGLNLSLAETGLSINVQSPVYLWLKSSAGSNDIAFQAFITYTPYTG